MGSTPNPYNPLQPTEDSRYFFGQEAAFVFFRQNLLGTPHRRALVLIGRRGLGKSSILRQLRFRLDDHYRPCVINLGTLDLTSEEVLIATLVDEIRDTLEQSDASTYRLPEWPDDEDQGEEPVNLRDWFNTAYLDVALAALRRERRLLLIFDDAHLLLQAIERGTLSGDLLHSFAEWQAAHPRLDLIVALDAAFEEQALNTDLLNDPTLHFRLTELPLEEAARLVCEPVQDAYRYDAGMEEQILELAGGHPFLLHSICRLLFRRSEERNHSGPITEHDLTAIMPAVLEQTDEILSPLWQQTTRNERLTLTALVKLGHGAPFETIYDWLTGMGYILNKTQLAAALRSLDYKGLVQTGTNGQFVFPATLIARWIDTNTSIPVEERRQRFDRARLASIGGLIAVLLIVGGLGVAALLGTFSHREGHNHSHAPTATLLLNLEATRQSDFATQTEQARPTQTPMPTLSLTPTSTPTFTSTPTVTPSVTPAATSTATRTPRPTQTHTSRPTYTRTPPIHTPRPTLPGP